MRHVATARENDKTCQDPGQRVNNGYSKSVPVGKEELFLFILPYFYQQNISAEVKWNEWEYLLITSEHCY